MEQLSILNRVVPDYAESFLSGKFKTDEMPLLESVFNHFSSLVNYNELSNVHLVACQHILIPQLNMFKMFVKLGIPAKQIYILPKVYSVNDEVILNLKELVNGAKTLVELFQYIAVPVVLPILRAYQ